MLRAIYILQSSDIKRNLKLSINRNLTMKVEGREHSIKSKGIISSLKEISER